MDTTKTARGRRADMGSEKKNPAGLEVPAWREPPAALSLHNNEVHLWRALLRQRPDLEALKRTLSKDETARADRFRFQVNRDDYVASHGILRTILSRYIASPPGKIRFSYNPFGKPALPQPLGPQGLRFNMSHSNGRLLIAVSRGREIGVDLEQIKDNNAHAEIAKRFFSARENAALRRLTGDRSRTAFYLLWTSKEAYIKARGEGLSFPLDKIDLAFLPEASIGKRRAIGAVGEPARWTLSNLIAWPDHPAAVVVEGGEWEPAYWEYRVPSRTNNLFLLSTFLV